MAPSVYLETTIASYLMVHDHILLEIRRVREEYAQRFKGDVHAMMDDLRRRHAESDRQSVSFEPKTGREKESPAVTRTLNGMSNSIFWVSEAGCSREGVPLSKRKMLPSADKHPPAPPLTAAAA